MHAGWGITRFKRKPTCHPEVRHYANGLCRTCYHNTPANKAKCAEYYRAHKDQYREQERRARARRAKQVKAYGITREAIEAMLTAQGHVCALCGKPPGRKPLSVDHDHRTGRIRGMLCGRCNTALGLLMDDPGLCERSARYLRHHSIQTAPTAA